MTPHLLLRCGCTIAFRENGTPLCPQHGLQVIVRALGMPPPRIRGLATGPHVATEDLGAWTGGLTGDAPPKES